MTDQEVKLVEPDNLVTEVLKLKHEGWRLVQICATKIDREYELTYSFGKDYGFGCLRLLAAPGMEIMSISNIYEPAFLYENEIHDLFGIEIKMITLDYHGNFYRIAKKKPFQ